MVFFFQEEISGVLGSSWLDVQRLFALPPLLGSGSGLFFFFVGHTLEKYGEKKMKNQTNIHVTFMLCICYYYSWRLSRLS